MNRPAHFMIVVPLLAMFTAASLSALAEEPRRGEPRGAMHYAHHRFDPHHFDHRLWALGRAYPHGCRWGRCGYWWWADGYWYFYDHPLNGPPELVSDIAYDEQGNLVPVAAAMPGPPGPPGPEGMPPPPPGAMGSPPPTAMGPPPPPPPPAPSPVAGAIVGGAVGGIVGGALGRGPGAFAGAAIGATTGAVVAAEAQARPGGYYWWRGACYYRYPNGAWSPAMGPHYCGY